VIPYIKYTGARENGFADEGRACRSPGSRTPPRGLAMGGAVIFHAPLPRISLSQIKKVRDWSKLHARATSIKTTVSLSQTKIFHSRFPVRNEPGGMRMTRPPMATRGGGLRVNRILQTGGGGSLGLGLRGDRGEEGQQHDPIRFLHI
jgi:hypothetical protein